jgi:hypothetical protein
MAPLEFWLCKLFQYLDKTKSRHLFAPSVHVRIGDNPQSDLLKPHAGETVRGRGGIITNVYEASSNFCFWLQKKALEAFVSIPERSPKRGKPERHDPVVAMRSAVVKSNLNTSADDMCEIFDRQGVPLPSKWMAAGFKKWSVMYKDHNYRGRIAVLISKDKHRT